MGERSPLRTRHDAQDSPQSQWLGCPQRCPDVVTPPPWSAACPVCVCVCTCVCGHVVCADVHMTTVLRPHRGPSQIV